jgi:hypothetical protein
MISDNLFESVLLHTSHLDCDTLVVVSGYSTAPIIYRHFEAVEDLRRELKIEVIVGMGVQDGIRRSTHEQFKKLVVERAGDFHCKYITTPPPIHSKLYIWLKNGVPAYAYSGSANYSSQGFNGSIQGNLLSSVDPVTAFDYYNNLLSLSHSCDDQGIESLVKIYDEVGAFRAGVTVTAPQRSASTVTPGTASAGAVLPALLSDLEKVTLSLLEKRTGETPTKSGLNWGQRPGREPNQAYINVPAEIGRSDFFPDRKVPFTVLPIEDPGNPFLCVRAQDNGKAIETFENNSLMGRYFRNRLGLSDGAYVDKDDLYNYGRTDVTFYKLDEETFIMNFSI